LIFAVPLKMGVRVAACCVSEEKMHGVAAKVLKAMQAVENW
jgi:aromatic-amino-acid transaminase